MSTVTEIEELKKILYDPMAVQSKVLSMLYNSTDGDINIPDPSNPFIFLLESNAMVVSSAMHEIANSFRSMYPVLANTKEDLYNHLQSDELNDVFSTPSKASFTFFINKTQFMVNGFNSDNYMEMLIPKKTVITVSNTDFTLLNDVSVKLYSTGTLFVTIIGNASEIAIAKDTILPSGVIKDKNNVEWILINIEIDQLTITEFTDTILASENYAKSVTLTDQYMYTEATSFLTSSGTEAPLNISYSKYVYNVDYPTLYVSILGSVLSISLPSIYNINQVIRDTITIAIYTTKGKLSQNIEDYDTNDFIVKLKTDYSSDPRVIGINNISIYVKAVTPTYGGRDEIDFITLKNKVIEYTTGDNTVPITDNTLLEESNKLGFTLVKRNDNILEREYIALRDIDKRDSDTEISLLCDVFMDTFKIEQNIDNQYIISGYKFLILNPFSVFKLVNKELKILTQSEINLIPSINVKNTDTMDSYFHTIYRYIIEYEDLLSVRAYDVNDLLLENISSTINNDSLSTTLILSDREIRREGNNYVISFIIITDDNVTTLDINKLKTQITIPIPNSKLVMNYYGNIYIENEIYKCKVVINSTGFINKDDLLELVILDNNSSMFVNLKSNINIVIYTTDVLMTRNITTITTLVNDLNVSTGIYMENMDITLGKALKYLYTNYRLDYTNRKYLRYTEIEYLKYEETIYQSDQYGIKLTYSSSNNDGVMDTGVPIILHNKDDYVLDTTGEKIIKNNIGDIYLDEYNNPIIDPLLGMVHYLDILLVEYPFRTSNNVYTHDYLISLYKYITLCATDMLAEFNNRLLDNTVVKYKPMNNLKGVNLIVNNIIYNIPNFVKPDVTLYVDSNNYDYNTVLLFKKRISEILQNGLRKRDLMSNIETNIKNALGSSIYSVKIKNIDTLNDLDIKKYTKDSSNILLSKTTSIGDDGSLIITPVINLNILEI